MDGLARRGGGRRLPWSPGHKAASASTGFISTIKLCQAGSVQYKRRRDSVARLTGAEQRRCGRGLDAVAGSIIRVLSTAATPAS